jgi:hypothetical protein
MAVSRKSLAVDRGEYARREREQVRREGVDAPAERRLNLREVGVSGEQPPDEPREPRLGESAPAVDGQSAGEGALDQAAVPVAVHPAGVREGVAGELQSDGLHRLADV